MDTDTKQLLAAVAAVAVIMGGFVAVGLSGPSSVETGTAPTYLGADAATALSNLSETLETLIDPIITVATVILVFALVMGILARLQGWFKF